MKQDDRAPFDEALQTARQAAYAPGEYVGQESFMRATEIRALAVRAGVAPGVFVLDLCCGVAGPGRFLTRELGCTYLGVDSSQSAIDIARARAHGLSCRFQVARVPPLPPGEFDVVLLLETMLAFPDKDALLRDTVWLTPLEEMRALLDRVGLVVRCQDDCSRSHRAMADSLIEAFAADATAIAAQIGRPALDELLAAHRLWSGWLATGRVRKIACVAENPAGSRA